MALGDFYIKVYGIEVGDEVILQGIAGPYNNKVLWLSDSHIVLSIPNHTQWWGQQEHKIPASVMIARRLSADGGYWLAANVWQQDTGRQWRAIRKEALFIAGEMSRRDPMPDYGRLMTYEEFKHDCKVGPSIINYDGSGYYADRDGVSHWPALPSDFARDKEEPGFTHVAWFNK